METEKYSEKKEQRNLTPVSEIYTMEQRKNFPCKRCGHFGHIHEVEYCNKRKKFLKILSYKTKVDCKFKE